MNLLLYSVTFRNGINHCSVFYDDMAKGVENTGWDNKIFNPYQKKVC